MPSSNPTDLGTVYPPTSDTYTTQPQKPRPLPTQEASPRELRRAQSCDAIFAAAESANQASVQSGVVGGILIDIWSNLILMMCFHYAGRMHVSLSRITDLHGTCVFRHVTRNPTGTSMWRQLCLFGSLRSSQSFWSWEAKSVKLMSNLPASIKMNTKSKLQAIPKIYSGEVVLGTVVLQF